MKPKFTDTNGRALRVISCGPEDVIPADDRIEDALRGGICSRCLFPIPRAGGSYTSVHCWASIGPQSAAPYVGSAKP